MRQFVRTIASIFLKASYGRTAKQNTKLIKKFRMEIPTSKKCEVTSIFSGLLINCQAAAAINGSKIIMVTTAVQNHVNGSTNHPNNRSDVKASGVTLRLRLSNIFHLDIADSLFLTRCPLLSGIKGSIHAPICQSPLIHR